jgi:hypothetical protein
MDSSVQVAIIGGAVSVIIAMVLGCTHKLRPLSKIILDP